MHVDYPDISEEYIVRHITDWFIRTNGSDDNAAFGAFQEDRPTGNNTIHVQDMSATIEIVWDFTDAVDCDTGNKRR